MTRLRMILCLVYHMTPLPVDLGLQVICGGSDRSRSEDHDGGDCLAEELRGSAFRGGRELTTQEEECCIMCSQKEYKSQCSPAML